MNRETRRKQREELNEDNFDQDLREKQKEDYDELREEVAECGLIHILDRNRLNDSSVKTLESTQHIDDVRMSSAGILAEKIRQYDNDKMYISCSIETLYDNYDIEVSDEYRMTESVDKRNIVSYTI